MSIGQIEQLHSAVLRLFPNDSQRDMGFDKSIVGEAKRTGEVIWKVSHCQFEKEDVPLTEMHF